MRAAFENVEAQLEFFASFAFNCATALERVSAIEMSWWRASVVAQVHSKARVVVWCQEDGCESKLAATGVFVSESVFAPGGDDVDATAGAGWCKHCRVT